MKTSRDNSGGGEMNVRESAIGRLYVSLMDKTVLAWLKRLGLHPNTVTGVGLILACLVPAGFAAGPVAGLILIACSGMADSMDGLLARATGRQTAFGAFWDSTLDRAADCAYLLGFLVLFWPLAEYRFLAASSLLVALLFTLLISYTKARLESQGKACQSGFMSRPVRTIYLLLWALALALLPGVQMVVLWAGLGLYLVLTLATVGQRVSEARRVLA